MKDNDFVWDEEEAKYKKEREALLGQDFSSKFVENFKDICGKTVESIVSWSEDEIIIKFTDGTFIIIFAGIDKFLGEEDACLGIRDGSFSLSCLEKCGLLSEDVVMKIEQLDQKEKERKKREKEFVQYMTLKARFED